MAASQFVKQPAFINQTRLFKSQHSKEVVWTKAEGVPVCTLRSWFKRLTPLGEAFQQPGEVAMAASFLLVDI